MRRIIDLDKNWCFSKKSIFEVSGEQLAFETVNLPHTWNAVDGQDGGNDYYRGTCWYWRNLDIPGLGLGDEVYLEITGAAMTAEVYLNGESLAIHEGGYSTFRVNLTGHLKDENSLVISVGNSLNDHVYPQRADFTFYGGLYRQVRLIIVPKAHFALDYCGTPGIRITPVLSDDFKSAKATVTVWADNAEGMPVNVSVEGIGVQSTLINGGMAEVVFDIGDAHLWDGVNDPYLYMATAAICDEQGNVFDEVSARFGLRSFYMDPQGGFFLNGRSYPLRGVSRHQDRKGAGSALTFEMHKEDMDIIREMGANTIRLAHYQHAQEFYDLCDETGMVVWAEIPYITMHMKNGRANTLSQMEELVVQNYNHPSIVCWGLSNEITAAPTGEDEDLLDNHRQLNDLCHKLDKTRPTTMANVFMLEPDNAILDIPDISSYNLYFGWYLGDLDQNDSFFDEFHEKYPDRVIGFSEYGADANPAYQNSKPEKGDYSETYQCVYHEHILRMIENRPWLWATHVWNMFDFAADGRDEGGKNGENQKGLVTFDRKIKKDAFYLYKAYWSDSPFVHVCGSRYVNRAEAVTEVKVYSNLTEVTLLVDGKTFMTLTGEKIFKFDVPISGEHVVAAVAGDCTDSIRICRVNEPDATYVFGTSGDVANWFDGEAIDPTCFSIKDKLGDIQAHPVAGKIVEQMMAMGAAARGDVAESVKDNPQLKRMMARMTLQSMLKQAGDVITPEQIKQINATLQKIKK